MTTQHVVPSTMLAVVLERLGHPALRRIPVPVPSSNEVLIRTSASTVCTSDIIDIDENPFNAPLPRTMGHEAAGVVVAIGQSVTTLKIGDAVACHPVIHCGSCGNCIRGLGHLCSEMGHLGLNRNGTFAEYFCIREDRAVAYDPASMNATIACLLEPLCVCQEAIVRGRVTSGDNVLIVGDGPFGILIARLALLAGARVMLSGREPFRLQRAGDVIAIHEADANAVLAKVHEHTNGEGVDVSILCVSAIEAFDVSMRALRSRGRCVIFSAITQPAPVDMFSVSIRELEILGCCNDEEPLGDAALRLSDSRLDCQSLVTHTVGLHDWEKAFELAKSAKERVLKVAITMGNLS